MTTCPLPLLNKAAFNKLTTHQKRVAICRDVLARLDRSLFVPVDGSILSVDVLDLLWRKRTSRGVQDHFNERACYGCAKGALLASWIGSFDSVKPRSKLFTSLINRGHDHLANAFPKELVETFGLKLLAAIEMAFEGDAYLGWCMDHLSGSERYAIVTAISYASWENEACLRDIMTNVITNEGRLVVNGIVIE